MRGPNGDTKRFKSNSNNVLLMKMLRVERRERKGVFFGGGRCRGLRELTRGPGLSHSRLLLAATVIHMTKKR